MRNFLLSLFLIVGLSAANGQSLHWIELKDKPTGSVQVPVSPQTLSNRHHLGLPAVQVTDQPVSAAYLVALQAQGVAPRTTSRWLNAVSANLTPVQVARLRQLPFVAAVRPFAGSFVAAQTASPDTLTPERVLVQVNGEAFRQAQLTGRGVLVGVIDVGFYDVTRESSLQHLVAENRILDTHDFVNPQRAVFFSDPETYSDSHGKEVLQCITGYDSEAGQQYGLATGARFCLARTDHGTRETRLEEDYWVAAMERMDSLGVRIINTSLGYAQGFTNPKENYRPTDMTGNTSVISRATRIAAEEKGLLIVVSAGNEGDSAWEIVSTPGDSPWVLSVGATKAKSRDKIYYSSTGPAWLPYLKPDVSCFAANGTSFAAPVVTGFAACLLERHPSLTYKRLIEIIQRSGHLYPFGNNYLGYGVPDAAKALRLAADSAWPPTPARLLPVASRSYQVKVTNPAVESVVVFHKRDERMVIRQEALAPVKGSVTVNRPTGVQRSTVDLGNEVIEISWTGK